MTTMRHISGDKVVTLTLVISALMCVQESRSVILHKVVVPKNVVNASLPHVILDCIYSLSNQERDGLVLKWYLNGKTIFQWIPPSKPQGLGVMRGKIKLDYEINEYPFTKHRALFLHKPTTDMTGEYKCKVSTLQNEVSRSQTMVVYEPPREVVLVQTKTTTNQVNVTCLVDHIFPEPSIRIFHRRSQDRQLLPTEEKTFQYSNDAYWKVAFVVLADSSLYRENIFECHVFLPNTDYIERKSTIYAPGYPLVMASASAASKDKVRWHEMALLWTLGPVLAIGSLPK